jgi:hypothetical protein
LSAVLDIPSPSVSVLTTELDDPTEEELFAPEEPASEDPAVLDGTSLETALALEALGRGSPPPWENCDDAAAPLDGTSPEPMENCEDPGTTGVGEEDCLNAASEGKPRLSPPPQPLNPNTAASNNPNDKFFIIATLPIKQLEFMDWFLCR